MFGKNVYVNEELSELISPKHLAEGYKLEKTRDLIFKELELTKDYEKKKKENLIFWFKNYDSAILQHTKFPLSTRDVWNKEDIEERIVKDGFEFEDIKENNLRKNVSIRYPCFSDGSKYGVESRLKFKIDIIGDKHIFYINSDFCRGGTINRILLTWDYYSKELNKIYDYIVLASRFPYAYYESSEVLVREVGINIKNIKLVFNQGELGFRNITDDDLNWKAEEKKDREFDMLREKQDYEEEVNKASGLDKDFENY